MWGVVVTIPKGFRTLSISLPALLVLGLYKPLSTSTVKAMDEEVSTAFSVAYVTTPNETVASTIAHGLVKNKLAACVNIIPKVTSVYEWEDKICEDTEQLLMIKTRTSRVAELTDFVIKNHPYKVCEVIAVPIQQGSKMYLDWISKIVPEK